MDHNPGPFNQDLPNGPFVVPSGKPRLKYLSGPFPDNYPPWKIQNQSPKKTAYRLPTIAHDRSHFQGHLQHFNFHQVGNTLRL
jgi:hypothetical protein